MGSARTLAVTRNRSLRAVTMLLSVLVAAWLVLAAGGPAFAHDTLLESDPADGTIISEVPEQATLTFSADPTQQGAEALVIDADGNETELTDPVIDGRTATWDLSGVSEGANQIVWTVISSDGHRIDGTIDFIVGTADGPPTNELTSPGGETSSDETSSGEAPGGAGSETATDGSSESADEPGDSTDGAASPDDESGSRLPRGRYTPIIGGAAIALAVLAAVWFLVVRRRDSGADTHADD
ncbi:MAG: copper resistance protein CopC [Actinomycetaceae bacterium]